VKLAEHQKKREAGLLTTQRLAGKGEEVALSPCDGGVLHYGDVVQLRSEKTGLVVCVDLLEAFRDAGTPDEARAVTTSTISHTPSQRNAFVLIPYRPPGAPEASARDDDDMVVRYNEPVMFSTHPDCPVQAFLASSPKTLTTCARVTKHQEVATSTKATYSSTFKFVYVDPQLRLEKEGTPVEIGDRLVIVHCATGTNLAADTVQAPSDYGLEYEVFCRTCLDFKKAETPENHWKIVMAPEHS
jgi:hypothetical protein